MKALARPLPFALLALLGACSINVQDDRPRHDMISCSVECSGRQEASASCAANLIPRCSCEPAPSATCGDGGTVR